LRNTHHDDMTTDHKTDVFSDARGEINQWRSILWQTGQHQNLRPTHTQ